MPVTGAPRSSLLGQPTYPALAVGSLLWHVSRWGTVFAVSYHLAEQVGSSLLNQSVGSLLFLPMLLGGFLGGVLSDRYDALGLLVTTQWILGGITLVLLLVVGVGVAEIWMMFPYTLALGVGQLLGFTVQRDVLHRVAGPVHEGRALVVEAVSMAISMAFGSLLGGLLAQRGGLGLALAGMLALQLLAAWCYSLVRPTVPHVVRRLSLRGQLMTTRQILRASPRLVAALVVTVAMNLFVYGYPPLIPLLARDFDESAFFAGALTSVDGFGQVVGGGVLAVVGIGRSGAVFVCGALTTLAGILALTAAPSAPLAFAALLVAGMGTAAYAATQAIVAVGEVGVEHRGAVYGALTTAIGSTPVGMVLIGLTASWLSPRAALAWSALAGTVVVATVALRRREMWRRDPRPAGAVQAAGR